MCSVSNISVLILDEEYHGYYIHGKAPWANSGQGGSDVPLPELKKRLDEEIEGKQKQRGLAVSDGRIQSYEILVSPEIRQFYDKELAERLDL